MKPEIPDIVIPSRPGRAAAGKRVEPPRAAPPPPRKPSVAKPAKAAAVQRDYPLRKIAIGLRSRIVIWLLRHLLRPWLGYLLRGGADRLARAQLMVAARPRTRASGQAVSYRPVGLQRPVPGHVVGDLGDSSKPVVLWLHGGAFVLPASPDAHVGLVGKFCASLGAVGYLPDYRLAPFNKFPAALDDCEHAYRALLDLGFDASRIVVGGDSAGGNLLFGLLQRIRTHALPMPACAVAVSPATELGRTHAPGSRWRNRKIDALLAIDGLHRVIESYVGDADAADPELSPLFADCRGFPPLYFIASEAEVLLDDTVLLAQRTLAAGVPTTLDIWPLLPHAFPLFEPLLKEVRAARSDITGFFQQHLHRDANEVASKPAAAASPV